MSHQRLLLRLFGEDRKCIFNDDKTYKCKIHKFRPIQCVMFPLYPVDIENDLFINMGTCIVKSKKKTSINKWLNGDNIYKRNKGIYLKWIELVEELQPRWKSMSNVTQDQIRDLLFVKYDLNEDFEKQIIANVRRVREICYRVEE